MAHPFGERALVEQTDSKAPMALYSFGNWIHVRWSPDEVGIPLGQMPFFPCLMGHPTHLINHRRVEIIHAPVYRIQIERDARLIVRHLYRRTLTLRLRQVGRDQFPHDAICVLAPRPQKRTPAKLAINRPHHIAGPKRRACLLAALANIAVQFFRTWGFANEFLKICILSGEKNTI